jgi:hypothetical protein
MKMPPHVHSSIPPLQRAGRAASAFTAGMGRAACLLLLVIAIWGGLDNPYGWRVPAVGALLLALAAAGWWLAMRRPATPAGDAAWHKAGLAVLGVTCAAGFGWALAFDSNQASDFGIYYRCGTHFKDTLFTWMESCRSNYFHQPDYTYWSRALVYSAPFGLLFGDNYPLFKLYNAALHAATLAVLYFGVRRLAGARPAVVALILLALYPEWFFSVTMATPDNIGVGLLLGFLLLLPATLRTQGPRGWLLALALAVLAFLAHLARTLGPFLMITLVLATLVSLRRDAWKLPLLRAAAVVVLYVLANAALVAAAGRPIQGQFALLERISSVDLHEPLQNYRVVFGWLDQFLPVLPESARTKVALQRIVTELAHGFAEYPLYLLAKVRVFTEGTGYYLYSSMDGGANPDSVMTAPAYTVPTHPALVFILAGFVLFLASAAFLALLRGRRGTLLDACVFFTAVFCAVMLGFGDTQQRYSLLIAPALAIITAMSMFPSTSGETATTSASIGGLSPRLATTAWSLGALALLGGLFAAGLVLAPALARRIPEPLVEARQEAHAAIDGMQCNEAPVKLQANYKKLQATPAPAGGCFTLWAPLPDGARSVEFFLSRDEMRFPFEPRTAAPYRVRVEQGGRILLDADLGQDSVRWYQLNLQPAAAGQGQGVRFVVVPKAPGTKEPLDLWWLTPRARPAG